MPVMAVPPLGHILLRQRDIRRHRAVQKIKWMCGDDGPHRLRQEMQRLQHPLPEVDMCGGAPGESEVGEQKKAGDRQTEDPHHVYYTPSFRCARFPPRASSFPCSCT